MPFLILLLSAALLVAGIQDDPRSTGDGVYTLQIRRCATTQAWEPIWKNLMDIVDTKVVVEHVK